MTSCNKFEEEGLRDMESGHPLDKHYAACTDCQENMAAYACIKQALQDLDGLYIPPKGWEDNVWKSIEKEESSPKAKPFWMRMYLPATGMAVVFSVFMLIFFSGSPTIKVKTDLELSFQQGDAHMRGIMRGDDTPKPGDRLILKAETGDFKHVELRLYLNHKKLLFACTDKPPCKKKSNQIIAETKLLSAGNYQALLLASDKPLPKTTDSPDKDALQASSSGANEIIFKQFEAW